MVLLVSKYGGDCLSVSKYCLSESMVTGDVIGAASISMEITDITVTGDNIAVETGLTPDTTATPDKSASATVVDSNVNCGEASTSTVLTSPTVPTISTPTTLITYTPSGSQQWINRIDEKFTPAIGKTFIDLDSAIFVL
ncbi:uncharacterized protein LOC141649079 [Silene latifolia]|uniref:uncharacterized protein LOC141649079 n=1 Tax=Silene latifolia TaxID=37657 RepID=UPI003D78ABCE